MSHHCFRDSAHLQEFLSNTYNNLKCSLLLGLRFRAKLSQDGSSEKAGKKNRQLIPWSWSPGKVRLAALVFEFVCFGKMPVREGQYGPDG